MTVVFDIHLNLTTTTDTELGGDERTRLESAFARAASVPHFFVRARSLDADAQAQPQKQTIEVVIFSVSRNVTVANEILAHLSALLPNPAKATDFVKNEAQVTSFEVSEVEGPELRTRFFKQPPPRSTDGLSPMGAVFIVLAVIVSLGILYGLAREFFLKDTGRPVLIDPTEVHRSSESL